MPAEQEGKRIPLTHIHINLTDRSITFEAKDQTVAKLSLASEGVIFEATHQLVHDVAQEEQKPAALDASPSIETSTSKERQPVTLTGKLKNKPREGKPDAKGNPTAWARLAVHEEEREDAHMYSATFHRHTAKIALGLDRNAQITVQGYPHLSDDRNRMDTLSVINMLGQRGEAKKR